MTKRLVVGIDGSSESATALRWAIGEARRDDLELELVYALTIPTATDAFGQVIVVPQVEDFERYANDLLQAARQTVQNWDSDVVVSTRYAVGPPNDVLPEAAKGAIGLVVGSRGLGVVGGALLGSVSIRLAGQAEGPVYVIPHDLEENGLPTGGPVVVGVDGSIFSDAALRLALDHAAARRTALRVVSAYHIPWLAMPNDPSLVSQFDGSERAFAATVADEALARVRTADDRDTPVEVIITQGIPATALLEASSDASLTVVGSRGHGMLKRLLLGSVSRAVIQEATRPVAVVHVKSGENDAAHH